MSTDKPTYLNDHWTLADGLGFGATAKQLARVALQAQPPFTVALTGKWGAGKTSVLRQAFATLGGNPLAQAMPIGEPLRDLAFDRRLQKKWRELAYFGFRPGIKSEPTIEPLTARREKLRLSRLAQQCLCVWYSPWQHQQASNPLVPLLLEIKNQYTIWAKLTGKLSAIKKRSGLASLTLLKQVINASAALSANEQIKFASEASAEIAKVWHGTAPNLEQISDGQRFHLLFEEAIETLLQSRIENTNLGKKEQNKEPLGGEELSKSARLIVFIDDLDRCEESVIVQLLESIKLYLHSQRCVFILGIDPDAVLGALKRHWKERSEQSNAEYLEKLVQAQLEVPQPVTQLMRGLIKTQLSDHGIPIETPPQPSATEKTSGSKKQSKDADSEIAALPTMLEELLEPNPRKVKNFLNSLVAQWHLLPEAMQVPENVHLFALFHYLRLYHRPVWRLLSHQNWVLELLYRVLIKSDAKLGLIPDDYPSFEDEQAIATEMLARAFSHVLADNSDATTAERQHRNMPLEQAVQLFTEKLDRKRSDQCFIFYLRKLVRSDDAEISKAVKLLLQQMNQARDDSPA